MGELARIKIGPWTATPALNLLERGTQSIKIEPRAMDVLVVLARHSGAVVSVEELIASAWKGVVVGDGSVYLAIRQLRQALDDPPSGTRYIETIPKRGYRLTVPAMLEPVPTGLEPTPAQAVEEALTRPSGERLFPRWLAAAVAAAVVVAGIAFALRDGKPPQAENSVAVLPFENLSSDPEQAYFADGVTTEILNTLSGVRDLRVTGQLSSSHFKDRNESAGTIGATLGVTYLLQGSVRKAGDQLRIAARLSNARTGEQLWSESYERRLDDVFLIQDEIAQAVANALQVKLGVGDLAQVPGMTRDVAAYDEYLRGMAQAFDARPESFPLRIAHLQRAVALDPAFAIAWAALGMTYLNGAIVLSGRAEEWGPLSATALERARSLTPDAPHVLLATGITETRRGDWLEAASIFKRLEASSVRYGMARQAWDPRGTFLVFVGRVREAVPVLERARAEDPLAPGVASYLSLAYLAGGDLAGALAENGRGLALEGPKLRFLVEGLLIALNGRDTVEIDRRLDALPDELLRLARLVRAPAEATAEIRELAATASPGEKTALAFFAAYLKEPELSLALWSEGTRSPDVLWQPMMRDVRQLPAFKEVVRELGLVDYWRAYGWSDFCRPIGDEDFACT